ncbi:shugoshin-1 isoform X1 [Olea europaea subsp. europaea]|nr:shugoshin-1 isoform X1 [Olea europaea subsp. europaea]
MALVTMLAQRKYPLRINIYIFFIFAFTCHYLSLPLRHLILISPVQLLLLYSLNKFLHSKIIEQSGIELEKLRVNLLKMQEQNQQLAQSNTQMLAELNSGKDRLRALQHELGCKNGLLRARQLQLEEKERMKPCQNVDSEVMLIKCEDPGESLIEDRGDKKPRNTRKRSQSYSSSDQVQSKDKTEKRSSVRRQSARFKAEEKEPAEDLFEMRYARFPVCSLPDGEVKKCFSAPRYEPQKFGRSSLGRPSRQAAIKVQSYKEIPLNVKMRR